MATSMARLGLRRRTAAVRPVKPPYAGVRRTGQRCLPTGDGPAPEKSAIGQQELAIVVDPLAVRNGLWLLQFRERHIARAPAEAHFAHDTVVIVDHGLTVGFA
jgi:hypothetical protein